MGSVANFASAMKQSEMGQAFRRGMGRAVGFDYEHGQNMGFLGRNMEKGMFGAGKFAFGLRLLGPVMVGMSLHSGFEEGGVLGLAKAGAMEMAMWGGFEMGVSFITGGGSMAAGLGLMAGAGVVAAGIGAYKIGESARKHRKRLRHVEMGSDLVDRFGTMSTMRQRSLSAIQRSHINGRTALGNEALILSQHLR